MRSVVLYISTILVYFCVYGQRLPVSHSLPAKSPRLCRRFINFMDRQRKPVKNSHYVVLRSVTKRITALCVQFL